MPIYSTCKHLTRLSLLTILTSPLLLAAASQPVIGSIVKSSHATLAGVTVPGQGTLTTGAVLSTAKGGSAWVRFSSDTQAGLSEETSVRFSGADGRVSAKLSSGTMAAKSSGNETLVVETPRFKIEPAQGKAVYIVAMLPGNTTIVSARLGNLAVTETNSGKKHLVPAGHYAKISNAPAGVPGQAGAPAAGAPPGLLSNAPALFAISVGAGIGVGFGIAEGPLSLPTASPSAP